jgi:hypothetical protein
LAKGEGRYNELWIGNVNRVGQLHWQIT